MLLTVAFALAAAAGCAGSRERTAPTAATGASTLMVEPGLKLVYRCEETGREWQTEYFARSLLGGQEVIPVVAARYGEKPGEAYVSYVAVREGWLVEVGARDPNGRAAWPEPRRVFPLDAAPGTAWEEPGEGYVTRYRVEAVETITVPAGRFRVARVLVTQVDPSVSPERVLAEQRVWCAATSGIAVRTELIRVDTALGDRPEEATEVLVRVEKGEPRPDPGLS
ncbi:MAG: hypothetical protein AB1776_04205 [Bacillota bacterium]